MGAAVQGAKTVEETFGRHYIRARYIWTQIFTEHLADCSRVFRGDLQAVLIMAVVGQAYLSRHLSELGSERDYLQPAPVLDGVTISASSLAEILGIPRETVRRKLEEMRRAGWIEKDERAGWRIAINDGWVNARQDLDELDRRSIARMARMAAEFGALGKAGVAASKP